MSVEEHTIELAGSPVFYRSATASGTPVLYLHGVPTSSDDWIAFLERTGGLAPDLPGFGRSGKGGHLDYSLDGHAAFLERLLAHLRVDRVALVAHDWGAGGGLVFAQRHPERVERLVLLNPLPLLSGDRPHRLARIWRTPGLGELAMGSSTRWLLARALRRGGPLTDAQIAAIWAQLDQGTQRAILRLHRSTGEQQLAEIRRHLERLTMPALLVHGTRDPWFGPETPDAYAADLPQATVERLERAGHWPWLEDPGVIERVARFLGQAR